MFHFVVLIRCLWAAKKNYLLIQTVCVFIEIHGKCKWKVERFRNERKAHLSFGTVISRKIVSSMQNCKSVCFHTKMAYRGNSLSWNGLKYSGSNGAYAAENPTNQMHKQHTYTRNRYNRRPRCIHVRVERTKQRIHNHKDTRRMWEVHARIQSIRLAHAAIAKISSSMWMRSASTPCWRVCVRRICLFFLFLYFPFAVEITHGTAARTQRIGQFYQKAETAHESTTHTRSHIAVFVVEPLWTV